MVNSCLTIVMEVPVKEHEFSSDIPSKYARKNYYRIEYEQAYILTNAGQWLKGK